MNISLKPITKALVAILSRFHAVIFTVVVLGSLSVAVLILSDTVTSSTGSTNQQTSTNTLFDEDTIERIKKLKNNDDTSNELVLPSGRINPFSE